MGSSFWASFWCMFLGCFFLVFGKGQFFFLTGRAKFLVSSLWPQAMFFLAVCFFFASSFFCGQVLFSLAMFLSLQKQSPNIFGVRPNIFGVRPKTFGVRPNMFCVCPKTFGLLPKTWCHVVTFGVCERWRLVGQRCWFWRQCFWQGTSFCCQYVLVDTAVVGLVAVVVH